MVNYSYNSNGIDFTIEGNDMIQFSKLANADGSLKRGDIVPLINAVEIDWNNADLGNNTYINTTGELLSYISGLMQRVEYYEKPQRVIVTSDISYNADFNVNTDTKIPNVTLVTLKGKNSYAKLNARYVPAIDKYKDTTITWKEITTNSYIVLTANKNENEGGTDAMVKSSSCFIRPNDVINEITTNSSVTQQIKAFTDIKIYDDTRNPYAYKYVDVVISEGSIKDITSKSSPQNVDASGAEITLSCELTHDKFNLTVNDCNYSKPSDITWITYNTKKLSNDGLYTFTFTVSDNPKKTSREAIITLNATGITKTIKYTIIQSGRGEIITGVDSGVNNNDNEITLYTNGNTNSTPTDYQLSPSLIKS